MAPRKNKEELDEKERRRQYREYGKVYREHLSPDRKKELSQRKVESRKKAMKNPEYRAKYLEKEKQKRREMSQDKKDRRNRQQAELRRLRRLKNGVSDMTRWISKMTPEERILHYAKKNAYDKEWRQKRKAKAQQEDKENSTKGPNLRANKSRDKRRGQFVKAPSHKPTEPFPGEESTTTVRLADEPGPQSNSESSKTVQCGIKMWKCPSPSCTQLCSLKQELIKHLRIDHHKRFMDKNTSTSLVGSLVITNRHDLIDDCRTIYCKVEHCGNGESVYRSFQQNQLVAHLCTHPSVLAQLKETMEKESETKQVGNKSCTHKKCKFRSSSKKVMAKHNAAHNSQYSWQCLLCYELYKTKRAAQLHLGGIMPGIPLENRIAFVFHHHFPNDKRRIPYIRKMVNRALKDPGLPTIVVGTCSRKKAKNVVGNPVIASIPCPFTKTCVATANSDAEIIQHISLVHAKAVTKNAFSCGVEKCCYRTDDKAEYRRHQLAHDKRSFCMCVICNDIFRDRPTLKNHHIKNYHDAVFAPYLIRFAPFAKQSKTNKWACTVEGCRMSFYWHHKFEDHLFKHADDVQLDCFCGICGWEMQSAEEARNHYFRHHTKSEVKIRTKFVGWRKEKQRIYKCSVCFAVYEEEGSLLSHVGLRHPEAYEATLKEIFPYKYFGELPSN